MSHQGSDFVCRKYSAVSIVTADADRVMILVVDVIEKVTKFFYLGDVL